MPLLDTEPGERAGEVYVNMGPQHPSTHGVLRLMLKLEGEVIVGCVPHMGYLHRGSEKLAEKRTYPQYVTLTDRDDYLCAMINNQAYVQTVEKLLGTQIPERADYLRVIAMELNRIASHLVWLGTFAMDVGALSVFLYCFREREHVLKMFEELCGARLTYSFMRIGGVAYDMPGEEWSANLRDWLNGSGRFALGAGGDAAHGGFPTLLDETDNLLTGNEIFLFRTQNVGVLSLDDAIALSCSGPMVRGSGLAWDIRRADPYSIYERFEFDIPTRPEGDCFARYIVRLQEMWQSRRILFQALDQLPEGPVMGKVGKVIKPPAGEAYTRVESPRGELAGYLVSDGKSQSPWRYHVRAPSFCNLKAMEKMCLGWKVADTVAILGSIDIVLGDVDR
ncbi:MAG TPA: NADH-quinone oxidoreductase subunit D [Armatimonadota bacterium]|jgi:NADH-quinone oxidoreductase subunit D